MKTTRFPFPRKLGLFRRFRCVLAPTLVTAVTETLLHRAGPQKKAFCRIGFCCALVVVNMRGRCGLLLGRPVSSSKSGWPRSDRREEAGSRTRRSLKAEEDDPEVLGTRVSPLCVRSGGQRASTEYSLVRPRQRHCQYRAAMSANEIDGPCWQS